MSKDSGSVNVAGSLSMKPKRLVAYVRVSSKGQLDNYSIAKQIAEIEKYCEFKGHKIVAICQDAESGKSDARAGFESALNMVFNGAADGIVVYSLDRFARKALRGWQIIQDLEDAGKHLVVVNRDLDTTGPTGALIRNILLAVAEYELALLQERFSNGREAKKTAGGYYAGQPRFGWRSVGGCVEPVPTEQFTIRLLLRFRELGVSSYRCANYLNANIKRHPTKKGGEWTHKTIERVLKQQQDENNGYKLFVVDGGKSTTNKVARS